MNNFTYRNRTTENVISEIRRLNRMVQQNNTGTSISNVQKTVFNAKDTTPSMEWSEEAEV